MNPAAMPTERMKALYQHNVGNWGEPRDLIWFDPAITVRPTQLSRIQVCVWPADDNCDVSTFATLGMSEREMLGSGVSRVELHFAIRAFVTQDQAHQVARFLANVAEYPFENELRIDWWHRLRDAGNIPMFPGKRRLLFRPPFTEGANGYITWASESIRFLYLVPLTDEQAEVLSRGKDAYEQYLIDNELDPLGEPG